MSFEHNIPRRDFLKASAATSLGLLGLVFSNQAQAAVIDQVIADLLLKPGNWGTYDSRRSYLLWTKAGVALDTFIKRNQPAKNSFYRSAIQYSLNGRDSGVLCPDGECVALVRAATPSWGESIYKYSTGNWTRGDKVYPPPTGKIILPGTVIARFNSANNYVGAHTCIFAGNRQPSAGGGFSVWQQNVPLGHPITWESYLPKAKGYIGYDNPDEYYTVVLKS